MSFSPHSVRQNMTCTVFDHCGQTFMINATFHDGTKCFLEHNIKGEAVIGEPSSYRCVSGRITLTLLKSQIIHNENDSVTLSKNVVNGKIAGPNEKIFE